MAHGMGRWAWQQRTVTHRSRRAIVRRMTQRYAPALRWGPQP